MIKKKHKITLKLLDNRTRALKRKIKEVSRHECIGDRGMATLLDLVATVFEGQKVKFIKEVVEILELKKLKD